MRDHLGFNAFRTQDRDANAFIPIDKCEPFGQANGRGFDHAIAKAVDFVE